MPPILHKNLPLLEVDDPALMDGFFADPKTAEFLLERLGDTIALIDPDRIEPLLARLRKLEYLPKVVG